MVSFNIMERAFTSGQEVDALFVYGNGKNMAKLQNPQNNLDSIRQDYKDKHAASGGALFAGRLYDRQVWNKKEGKFVFNTDGSPKMYRHYIPSRQLITNEDELVKESHWFSEKCKNDCYCTINSFPADCDSKAADNVAYLTGFYIDFDNRKIHALARNQQASELVQEAMGYADQIVATLADYLQSDFGMPVISYTGGGYGFYFRLHPLEATEQNKALYKSIHEKLYQRFNILFAEISDVFDNDHAVVGDIARVIRITGTYNSKTGAFAQYIARYGYTDTNEIYAYSLEEISSLYRLEEIEAEPNARLVKDSPLPLKREREKKAIPKGAIKASSYTKQDNVLHPIKWYQGFVCDKQIGKYLELATTSLQYLDENGSLQRNSALFLISCLETEIAYAQYGSRIFSWDKIAKRVQQEIIDDVIELNDSLSEPLEDYELANILNHALTNNYHFRKLSTIQKFLNLSDDEFEALGWLDKQKKEAAKQERNNALTDIDKNVIKLYLSGLSDAKIAEQLGITKRTSINIRQRLGVTDRSAKWEDVDFDGNKRHLLNKTHRTPDAAEKELLADIRRLTDAMERIAASQICDKYPAKFGDFIENNKYLNGRRYLPKVLGISDGEELDILLEYFYKLRIEYLQLKNMLKYDLEKLEEMRKEAAEKRAEKQAEQAEKILRADSATWFCHEPKFGRHNHANLVVEEIDGQRRAFYV